MFRSADLRLSRRFLAHSGREKRNSLGLLRRERYGDIGRALYACQLAPTWTARSMIAQGWDFPRTNARYASSCSPLPGKRLAPYAGRSAEKDHGPIQYRADGSREGHRNWVTHQECVDSDACPTVRVQRRAKILQRGVDSVAVGAGKDVIQHSSEHRFSLAGQAAVGAAH